MTRALPPFLHDLLNSPPRAGAGVHAWLYRVARQLHPHLPATEIVALLESRVANCGRCVPRSEIVEAVQNSLVCAWQPSQSTAPRPATKPKWPALNQARREAVVRDNGGLADLWEISRPRLEDSDQHTEEIIDRLFPGNPLLCVGQSDSDFDTKPRNDWRGVLATMQFIVPSPMTARFGRRKKDGKLSAHTLDNTGPRWFQICEFDTGDIDGHAALLLHLGTFAPLVCAVHSGGKSLHGWFYVHDQPEEKVEMFFRYAVSLGADHSTWTPSQFVRMPDGTRANGKHQTVYFLNFKPLEACR